MLSVRLFNSPNMNWELDDRNKNCIRLYSPKDLTIFGTQFFTVHFDGMEYEFDEDVVGIPFLDKECTHSLKLYHPEGSFRWRGARQAKLALKAPTIIEHFIPSGSLLAKVNLMSIQFFNLMKRHDNSDKGLRSASIKIELIDYDKKCLGTR